MVEHKVIKIIGWLVESSRRLHGTWVNPSSILKDQPGLDSAVGEAKVVR